MSPVIGLCECATFAGMNQRVNTFVIIAASALATGSELAWIKVLPAGTFRMRDNRGPFHAGAKADLQAIVDRTLAAAGDTELMIDYDHQSVFGAVEGVGGQAPAAGWIKQLEARDDGIWAQVAWTTAAAEKIAADEYRYISPLFMSTKSGQVTRLLNAALVNMPALDLSAVAASTLIETEEGQNMKKIAKLLGLDESASEDAILAALGERHGKVATAAGLKADASIDDVVKAVGGLVGDRGKIATAAGLKADASTDEVVAAMGKATDGMVPASSFRQLQTDFNALKESVETKDVEAAVAAAIEGGKVTPANRDWAMRQAKSDLKGFQEFVANAPVIAASQFGNRDLPGADDEDPNTIAASAQHYQDEQAKLGRTVSMAAAVQHVHSQKKK